eukprot:8355254-Alexandrium_andersonii.AAC.1
MSLTSDMSEATPASARAGMGGAGGGKGCKTSAPASNWSKMRAHSLAELPGAHAQGLRNMTA